MKQKKPKWLKRLRIKLSIYTFIMELGTTLPLVVIGYVSYYSTQLLTNNLTYLSNDVLPNFTLWLLGSAVIISTPITIHEVSQYEKTLYIKLGMEPPLSKRKFKKQQKLS